MKGATFLTERQGGSDVGANVVKAVADGENYRLYGEKYFASNAGMAGVAMVLARMEGSAEGSRGTEFIRGAVAKRRRFTKRYPDSKIERQAWRAGSTIWRSRV